MSNLRNKKRSLKAFPLSNETVLLYPMNRIEKLGGNLSWTEAVFS